MSLVSALEIMEHLDCPRDFLREINVLLQDGGHVVLTTPNIGHWTSRLTFLLSGEHRFFDEVEYRMQRHVSPMTDLHVRLMLEELGFQLLDQTTAGSFDGPLKRLLQAPLAAPFTLFGKRAFGYAAIYLAKKQRSHASDDQ